MIKANNRRNPIYQRPTLIGIIVYFFIYILFLSLVYKYVSPNPWDFVWSLMWFTVFVGIVHWAINEFLLKKNKRHDRRNNLLNGEQRDLKIKSKSILLVFIVFIFSGLFFLPIAFHSPYAYKYSHFTKFIAFCLFPLSVVFLLLNKYRKSKKVPKSSEIIKLTAGLVLWCFLILPSFTFIMNLVNRQNFIHSVKVLHYGTNNSGGTVFRVVDENREEQKFTLRNYEVERYGLAGRFEADKKNYILVLRGRSGLLGSVVDTVEWANKSKGNTSDLY